MTELTGHERTVLVVDDIAAIRILASAILGNDGSTVLQASDGEEAISMARDESPDVILLDIAMPGLSGIEVLKTLRADPETQDIPVIIVTALAHSEMAEQATSMGANDLIEKPFRPAELRLIVDKWTTKA